MQKHAASMLGHSCYFGGPSKIRENFVCGPHPQKTHQPIHQDIKK